MLSGRSPAARFCTFNAVPAHSRFTHLCPHMSQKPHTLFSCCCFFVFFGRKVLLHTILLIVLYYHYFLTLDNEVLTLISFISSPTSSGIIVP
jgi:hypothetical protein